MSTNKDAVSRYIKMKNGLRVRVDATDYEWLSQWSWHICAGGKYVGRTRNEDRARLYMHREIMQAPKGKVVDHINGNTLDNRRANLRITSNSVNGYNRKKRAAGVSFCKQTGKWRAFIGVNNSFIHLGRFKTKREARAAYKAAGEKYYG